MSLRRGGTLLNQVFADTSGQFAFTQLTEGDYEVEIERAGYQTYHRRVGLRYPGHEEERFSVRLVPLDSTSQGNGRGQGVPAKARKALQQGLRLGQAGKHDQAAKQFAKAVSLAPGYVDGWIRLGIEHRMLKRWQEAESALGQALELNPESALASVNLGMVFLAQGKVEPARTQLQETVRLDPKMGAPHLLLGMIAYQEQNMDAAAREFRRALELDPQGSAESRMYLGSILAWRGEFPAAIAQLEQFLQNNPGHPQTATAEKLLQDIHRTHSSPEKR